MVYMTAITAFALLLIASTPARAYIDPGSGSYMFQLAVAGILAAVFSVKMYWRRLKTFVSSILTSRSRTGMRREV